MRTKAEIRTLLKQLDGKAADDLEAEDLEFKSWEDDPRSLHRLLREFVVCFANARGGTIVLGVEDRKRTRREAISGVGRYDASTLRRAIYDGTDPHILVEIEELTEPEGPLLLVHVPRGMPPHTTSDGVARIRIGKDCKPLTGRTFAQLLASGGQRDPTTEVLSVATLADLDTSEIDQLKKLIQSRNPESGLFRLTNVELLRALQLLDGELPTLAAILLVGTETAIRRYVPQHEVILLRQPTSTRYDQRRDLRGPILSILREVEQFIHVNNRIRTIAEEGFGQLELPDLSWEVAREAVLNAVTHRDYFLHQGVTVVLHRDRVEVTNPGGFVGGVSPDNILRHPPIHRNELLARVFQTIGLVNRVGLGVDRIFDGLLRLGKGIPTYSADEAHVRVTLPLTTQPGFAIFVADETRKGHLLDLDDLLILHTLQTTAALDRWAAASVLQLDPEQAAIRLASLRERGYLIVRGRGRTATYTLRRNLFGILRGVDGVHEQLPANGQDAKSRVLAVLREQGRLTNAEARRLTGLNRIQISRLFKALEEEGDAQFVGKGRGAHLVPIKKKQ